MYEMLVGYPPFYSDDPITTCRKVMFFEVNKVRTIQYETSAYVLFELMDWQKIEAKRANQNLKQSSI